MNLIITIDGPAGAGKTTTARGVARELEYRYLDTGALYRALALAVLRAGVTDAFSPEALKAIEGHNVAPRWKDDDMQVLLDGVDVSGEIRSPEVTALVSPLSAVPEVRDVLLEIQREPGQDGALVLDGRDTGSVVFPDADLKIYLNADSRERAGRRRLELRRAGIEKGLDDVLQEIEERDRRDSSRPLAPLTFPDGGVEIDTTGLTIEEQITRIVALARSRGA